MTSLSAWYCTTCRNVTFSPAEVKLQHYNSLLELLVGQWKAFGSIWTKLLVNWTINCFGMSASYYTL